MTRLQPRCEPQVEAARYLEGWPISKKNAHKWAFKPGMRAGAFSWRGSAKAIDRMKAAASEIRAVNRVDPVVAADGVVALAERIWPAFEHIDTSSGALGNAVSRTLTDLVPVLIDAPAEEKTRAKWLERLRTAIEQDGVDYLAPVSERFGEIAKFPSLLTLHAERDFALLHNAWSDHSTFSYLPTATLTLSCLLEAGRHDDLLALLDLKKTRLWSVERFAAEALLREGREEEALHRAAALLDHGGHVWGRSEIARFCESVLSRQGRHEEAYRRFGLPGAKGNTYIAKWRALVKRYPDRDPEQILTDLIDHHARKGKWFAAAKTAGFFDIALDCAASPDAEPKTLIRAARDFEVKKPEFAMVVAGHAVARLVEGAGFEPVPQDLDQAVHHMLSAADRMGRRGAALAELHHIARSGRSDGFMAVRLSRLLTTFEP